VLADHPLDGILKKAFFVPTPATTEGTAHGQ